MKSVRLIVTILLIIVLLTGCNRIDDQSSETTTPSQTATGGIVEAAENINVKDIDIAQQNGSIVITISMLSGSRENGYPESKLVKLPEYEVSMLESPERLMITLSNISFWDYQPKDSWEFGGLVAGLFREYPAQNDTLVLYVQLLSSAEFRVDEANGELVITLSRTEPETQGSYYCVADAFLEHQEGTWPKNIDMTPVLCSDTTNKLLISKPFTTENEAKNFVELSSPILESELPAKSLYVVYLKQSTLPNYEINESGVSLDDYSVILANDVVVKTPAFIENGRFLDTAADGRIAFARSYMPEEPSMEQDDYLLSDKVWIKDTNGRITELDMPEFFSVKEAAFSYDGTKLAILDVSIENSVLYVYDFDTSSPINLGEEGFGSLTNCFAWSDESDVLYAMTGSDDRSIQLRGCEFTGEGYSIFTVEEEQGGAGSMAVSKGRIFFADRTASEEGVIYEIGEERRQVCSGVDFKISDDGKTILVLESYSTGGEERTTNLKLCDIGTLVETYIVKDTQIENFDFSQNQSRVFYTTSSAQNAVDDYQYEFYAYDIVTETKEILALCSSTDFVVSDKPGVIYFIKEISDTQQNFFAAFEYDLNQ